jgi:hypothetical protein
MSASRMFKQTEFSVCEAIEKLHQLAKKHPLSWEDGVAYTSLEAITRLVAHAGALREAALQLETILLRLTEKSDKHLRSDHQALRLAALEVINSADRLEHPDTFRLNHLIAMNHSVLGATGNPKFPTVESIQFIFEAKQGKSPQENVRAAIERDIDNFWHRQQDHALQGILEKVK